MAVVGGMTVTAHPFGRLADGSSVDRYVLNNGRGLELHAITLGGIITALHAPDRRGRSASIVLGHSTLEPYRKNDAYLGAIIGRFANRIADGRLSLAGRTHQLSRNDGAHHLHGGSTGFDQHVWHAALHDTGREIGVAFSRLSPEGEEGYPGAVRVTVSYLMSPDNHVTIEYQAVASAPTIINLTQHSYFDLSAGEAASVLDHDLLLNADSYLPVDDTLIPLGDVASVADTPFDFRRAMSIRSRIGADHDQLHAGRGYDHTWVLNPAADSSRAAMVTEPVSGRCLEIWTTEPGIQFYSGNMLDGSVVASGRVLQRHAGLCLETQHFPDSPHRPAFPTTMLLPSQRFRSKTVWRLSTIG